MPAYLANPTTGLPPVSTATESKYYAFSITTPLGLMQFARTWNQVDSAAGVPTPISALQSKSGAISIAVNATSDILVFTGISTVAIGSFYYTAKTSGGTWGCGEILVAWNPTNKFAFEPVAGSFLVFDPASVAGDTFRVKNTGGQNLDTIYWTFRLHRIQ